jgi:hypothetical protein
MTEKEPQEEMEDKLSKMGRKRAGRLVQPTVADMAKARKEKGKTGTSRREMMAALRGVIGEKPKSRGVKTIKQQRHAKMGETASERAPQKAPFLHARSKK